MLGVCTLYARRPDLAVVDADLWNVLDIKLSEKPEGRSRVLEGIENGKAMG